MMTNDIRVCWFWASFDNELPNIMSPNPPDA